MQFSDLLEIVICKINCFTGNKVISFVCYTICSVFFSYLFILKEYFV